MPSQGSVGVVVDSLVGVLCSPETAVCLPHGTIQVEVRLVAHEEDTGEPPGMQLPDQPSRQADMLGPIPSPCTISGAAARVHYVVRDLHRLLWRDSGFVAEKKLSPSAFPSLRPADILVHNLFPARPGAIHFTIWTRLQDTVDELEQAVHKRRMYTAACESEGWLFKPWGTGYGTFGGLHPGALALTSRLANEMAESCQYGGKEEVSQLVWRAVLTAVIYRAAVQLARHVPPAPTESEEHDEQIEQEDSENMPATSFFDRKMTLLGRWKGSRKRRSTRATRTWWRCWKRVELMTKQSWAITLTFT